MLGLSDRELDFLAHVKIETLPRCLFKSNVEYFLFWFACHRGKGAFNAAQRSLAQHRQRSSVSLVGYVGYRRQYPKCPYRATAPDQNAVALWWKPYDSRQPFQLTSVGWRRAESVVNRVRAFLTNLIDDLTLVKDDVRC